MRKTIKSILKGSAGLMGVSLIDPIEVYFLTHENTFYPIISKSGCSSIKLKLIRKFQPGYENSFPAIHKVDPAELTAGKLQRLYFKTQYAYAKWTRGKEMVFVMREPISRLYSCYLDIIRSKNTMYLYPSGLEWYFKYTTDLSFDIFLKKVCSTPDSLSDRHFRSQTFYLSDSVKANLKSLETISLKNFMAGINIENKISANKSIKLNSNQSSIPEKLSIQLEKSREFNLRFKSDLELFKSIT